MRLLVAIGGAPHSDVALDTGLHVAELLAADATLLTVVPGAQAVDGAVRWLERVRSVRSDGGVSMAARVRIGRRDQQIVKEAAAGDYSLVVIGERPRHRIRTRLLGSIVTHVTSHAPCSVLIARGATFDPKRILICDSGARDPSVVERFAVSDLVGLARAASTVHVLHVMSQIGAGPGVADDQLLADADELMREKTREGIFLQGDLEMLQSQGIPTQVRVRRGLVVDEILAEIQEGRHGLIVIGPHRQAGWQRFLLDNLARQIITHTACPVLLIR